MSYAIHWSFLYLTTQEWMKFESASPLPVPRVRKSHNICLWTAASDDIEAGSIRIFLIEVNA